MQNQQIKLLTISICSVLFSTYSGIQHAAQVHNSSITDGIYFHTRTSDSNYNEAYKEAYNAHSSINTGLLHVTKHVPKDISVGQTYVETFNVKAKKMVSDTVVTESIPRFTTVVKTDPEATIDKENNQVIWKLGDLNKGESTTLKLWLKVNAEGESGSCMTATAKPRACQHYYFGKPALVINKTAPDRVMVGQPIHYTISVTNNGTTSARDIHIVDHLPSGLSVSDSSALQYTIDELKPGQSTAPIKINVKTTQRGEYCNTVVASSTNHADIDSQACTLVYKPELTVNKTGPQTALIGKNANYGVSVTNTGDIDLKNIKVVDKAPFSIVKAPGASINENTATWNIAHLSPGESKSFHVGLIGKKAGPHCNTISASSNNLSSTNEACTDWKGVPALLVEFIDTDDALLVGQKTNYVLSITNQGSSKDRNVTTTIVYPENIKPLSVTGPTHGKIDGQTVTISSYNELGAKETIKYVVEAQAVAKGSRNVEVKVNTDARETPVIENENTTIY